MTAMRTLLEPFEQHAASGRGKVSFLRDGEHDVVSYGYSELRDRARAIASALTDRRLRAERVLIAQPPGLDYMATVLGVLYAGAVAVPAFPVTDAGQKAARARARLEVIARDCDARCVLVASGESGAQSETLLRGALGNLDWVDVTSLGSGGSCSLPSVTGTDLAVLQYTSGSTTDPRGVMIQHENLIANASAFADERFFDTDEHSTVVSWVPLFHDLGLVSMFLSSLFVGASFVHLSAMHFIEDPLRWVRALSKHRGTHTAGPNFAYELCARRARDKDVEALDLRSVRVAMNGAEPARVDTVERFAARFAPCGLDPSCLVHHYGMAEHTAFVAGTGRETRATRTFASDALARGEANFAAAGRRLLSLGVPPSDHRIVVVSPETARPVRDGEVGEIWVASPSVGAGYFGKPEATAETFRARIDGDDATFLRTGDLGFFREGELFFAGRAKDIIIIAGTNHYPQDIERTVEAAASEIQPGSVAAIEIEADGEAMLAVVAEVGAPLAQSTGDRIITDVREAIARDHGVNVATIALVARGSAKKTTSGKIQRAATKRALLEGKLALVAHRSRLALDIPDRARDVILPETTTTTGTWAYEVDWRPATMRAAGARSGAVIVLGVLDDFTHGVARALEHEGARCFVVARESMLDASAVCEAFKAAAGDDAVRTLVVLAAHHDDPSTAGLIDVLERLRGHVQKSSVRRTVLVTRGAQQVEREASASPVQAAIWGAARAWSFDGRDAFTLVDLDSAPSGEDARAVAIAALQENSEYVHRGGRFYEPRVLHASRPAPGGALGLAGGGFVVGLEHEALGIAIASWLIENGARSLLLVGDGETRAARDLVAWSRERAVDVLVCAAADLATLDVARRPSSGAFLTVGLDGEFDLGARARDWAAVVSAFGADARLSSFVLCSRAVGILGAPSSAHEAAAAEMADSVVRVRRQHGLPAVTLAFGPIADEHAHAAALRTVSVRHHTLDDVLRAVGDSLRTPPPRGGRQLLLPFDLRDLVALAPGSGERDILRALAGEETRARAVEGRPRIEPRNAVERAICEMMAAALGLAELGIDESFFALGGDSILATGLLASVNRRFSLDMTPTQVGSVFTRFTVEAVAEVVSGALVEKVRALSASEVKAALDSVSEHGRSAR
jgi:acyl-CoA synthetase (AMP-forming)/AMP-acid ligase II